jgi:hypothetical protein
LFVANGAGMHMASRSIVVTANVTLTLDQLLEAIQQLDEPTRVEVARALLAADGNAKLAALIGRLAEREPADDISDAAINAEIDAVRHANS